MDDGLDDVAFLANSENRVAILETLAEGPHSRDDIRDRVEASRVTVARVLRELEDRNWIERSGCQYVATSLGEWVCDEFTRLLNEMEAERRLREPLQMISDDLLTFDVRRLQDAEVVLLDGNDPTTIVRRIVEFHRASDWIRGFSRGAAPVFVENQWELTVQGDTRLELVITPEARDIIRNHSPTEQRFREMLDEDDVNFFLYDGIPNSVGIVDGAVGINLTDDEGVLRGGLVTEDEAVYEWAVERFETYRDRARPVTTDAIEA